MTQTAESTAPLGMLWFLGMCAFASMASMRICDATLPAFAADFSVTTGQAAATVSAFALAYGVLQLFYGSLGDHFGKVRVIALATLGCTVGNGCAALSSSLDGLVLSRVVSGATAAGVIPLAMAWIGDNVSYDRRQEVLARFLGATVFGMVAGQWLGAVIVDSLGWKAAFAMLAVVFLVSGALLISRRAPLPSHSDAVPGRTLRRFAEVLSGKWARSVLAITFVEGALAFSALAFIPSHLHHRFGLSLSIAGAVASLYGIGGLVYSRCARRLVQRLGEGGLAQLGGACLAGAFTTLALATTWQSALPACLLAGFGFYALHNTLQTQATQMTPSVRGTAVSLFASALFLGQSVGLSVATWLVDRFSAAAVFAVAAIGLLVLPFAFTALMGRHRTVLEPLERAP
ncbi:MFS transporter [soil metagenome]